MPAKIPPHRKRTLFIPVPVNQKEKQRLKSFAEETGVSVAQVLRGSAMREVQKAERTKKTKAA